MFGHLVDALRQRHPTKKGIALAATILLVDDHPLFRKGLRLLLERQKDFLIVGEAGSGQEAIELAKNQPPDVVIMDIAMPDVDGIDATKQIRAKMPSVKVVALSMHAGRRFVENMLQAGAVGYILKKSVPEDLVNGIRAVVAGDVYLSPSITGVVVSGYKDLLSKSPNAPVIGEPLHILSTKLNRSQIPPDFVPRSNLMARLDELRRRPFTLVSGPAGCGKSTLASLWLEAWNGQHVWLTLGKEDNDLETFIRYLLAAIRKPLPEVCAGVHKYIQNVNVRAGSDLYGYLINDLDAIEEPLILVLDDFHNIRDQSVHELISALLAHPINNFHLIVLTRRDPPLITSTLRGRGLVNEIGVKDLHFDLAETTSFLKKTLRFSVDENSIQAIHTALEGWPAGLRLLSQSLNHPDDLERLMACLPEGLASIRDYLFAEVLSLQPPEMVKLMTATAILDRFCAPLCDSLKGVDVPSDKPDINGDEFIARLRMDNLFLIPMDTHYRWFRFHPLFKKLLQEQLKHHWRPEAAAALHSRAQAWLAENKGPDELFINLPVEHTDVEQAELPDMATPPTSRNHQSQGRFTRPHPPIEPLTHREVDVLHLLAERLSNKEIAERLFISITTVKWHLQSIYQKLDVNKRREAVVKAKNLQII